MRPKIYITQPVAPSAVERLRAIGDVEMNPDTLHKVTKDELLARVPELDILFCLLHDRIDKDIIAAGKRLIMIASMKITPSDIDVDAATARRLPVTVIAPIVTEATADIHFALILAVARRVVEGDQLVRAGVFPGAQSAHLLGSWVWGRTLGLIGGGGRIGKAVAKRAQGFSMRTLYWTPRRKPEAEEREAGLTYVPYDRLLAESDFVSVHAPLMPATRGLVNADAFAKMKKGVLIVNTARGPLIDEAALVQALDSGQVGGAALDVLATEPPPKDFPLIGRDNVILSPHTAFYSVDALNELQTKCASDVARVLSGEQPVYPVKMP